MIPGKKVYRSLMSNHGTHSRALLALGVVCLLWGTTWIASKYGVQFMPALELAGIRQVLGGLLYVFFFYE